MLMLRGVSVRSGNPYGSGGLFYMGAKKYAELAAWDVQKTSGVKWSLATMNCVMIFGPPSELSPRLVSSTRTPLYFLPSEARDGYG